MKKRLSTQLIMITIISFIIIIISLGIILPKSLEPVYEQNVYTFLEQPQKFINDEDKEFLDDMAFLVLNGRNIVVAVSNNFNEVVKVSIKEAISKINDNQGKFNIDGKTYYYSFSNNFSPKKIITITNDKYIIEMKRGVLISVIPITIATFIIVILLLSIWSKKLVNKIEIIKNKVVNIKNEEYDHKQKIDLEDELYDLEKMVEETRNELLDNEKFKNEMYQNISHDLKTPISVIKSYIEAIEDEMETKEKGLEIIKEQTNKLKERVESLLYLNKLEYYKNNSLHDFEKINISDLIIKAKEKFEIQNKKINWVINLDDSKMLGTIDMWEIVIDNILENFLRYANAEIKIYLKNNQLTFYNDGPKIEKDILKEIFNPYTKGLNGKFGLGLSIVKKTVELFGYKINIKNEENGVKFIIISNKE